MSNVVVSGLKITGKRLEATVFIGHNRVTTVINTAEPEVEKALAPLMKFISERSSADMALQLDRYLSPATKQALSKG